MTSLQLENTTAQAETTDNKEQPLIRHYSVRSYALLLKLALCGALGLGAAVAAAALHFEGTVSVGTVLLGALVGAFSVASGRAFSNQPASSEAIALVLQRLEDSQFEQAHLVRQFEEHRRSCAALSREIKTLRRQLGGRSGKPSGQPQAASHSMDDDSRYWEANLDE